MSCVRPLLHWCHSRYMSIRLRRRGVTVMPYAVLKDSRLEGWNTIWPHAYLKNCTVGLGSFFGSHTVFTDAEIGRFCSIASNVRMIIGRHPSRDYVSTHPAFFSTSKQAGFTFVSRTLFRENKYADDTRGVRLIIGNDVWVGEGAWILEGCSIGDGAIVGARCLVDRDVEPYSVVSGVPGRHVRYRFDENDRKQLLDFRWWDKELGWLRENSAHFSNIVSFKALMKNSTSGSASL